MSEQDGSQTTIQQRPTSDDKEIWKAYWEKRGQHWRTEPEVDDKRQAYLAQRCGIPPNIGQGIYPFKAWFKMSLNQCDN